MGVRVDYARGDRDRLEVISGDSPPTSPYRPSTLPQIYDDAIHFDGFRGEARERTLYWRLPQRFAPAANVVAGGSSSRVTAYGGALRYAFRFSGSGNFNRREPDVILRGANNRTLHYWNRRAAAMPDADNIVSVAIREGAKNWS